MSGTHTYALLEVSSAAYDEIAKKLKDAGYGHVFSSEGHIDMHGLALSRQAQVVHASDCAMHNEPASPNGPCDCGALLEAQR